jgi:hypothetical protein
VPWPEKVGECICQAPQHRTSLLNVPVPVHFRLPK